MKFLQAAILSLLLTIAASAQVPLTGAGLGAPGGAPAVYQGPGDKVASAYFFGGLRAYSNATAGTKVANICNSGDANCADINSLSNGDFDVTTAQGAPLNCGGTGGTCTIKILYDQSGSLSCAGSTACNPTNATAGNRPTLVFSCIGSLPCMRFTSAGSQLLTTAANFGSTIAQPNFTFLGVGKRTDTTSTDLFGQSGRAVGFRSATANQVQAYYGTVQAAAAADNSFWSVISVPNSTSSLIYLNGSLASTANAGTNGVTATALHVGAIVNNMSILEIGMWPAMNSTQAGQVASNECTYWGFAAC